MQRLVVFVLLVVLVGLAVMSYSRIVRNDSTLRFRVMGTEVVITVRGKNAPEHINAAYQTIKGVASLLDVYDPQSEVSLINRSAGFSPVKVAKDTFAAMEQALFVSELTKGAFDVTLKDFRSVKIDPFASTVQIKKAGIKIDLGGIGKGFAVEKAREALLKRGVSSALIDMHSSMAAIGGPWKIGIQDPSHKGRIIETVVLNNGEAISTSGNYEQGPHIVNPSSGEKVNTCRSVTIVAKDAGFADALSTALFVMGPSKALAMVKSLEGVRAVIVTSSGKVVRSWE